MSDLFQTVLTVSLSGSLMTISILMLRKVFALKLRPFAYRAMWGLLLMRLLLPINICSKFSIYNLLPKEHQPYLSPTINFSSGMQATPTLPAVAPAPASFSFDWLQLLSAIWLIGVVIAFCGIAYVNIKLLHEMKRNRKYEEPNFLHLLSACRKRLGIKRPITAIAMDGLSSPAVFGIVNPKILIPHQLFSKLNESEQRYIIMHELVHIKMWDTLLTLLMLLACAINWFNPIIWMGFMAMKRDIETACDYITVSKLSGKRKSYANTLISIASLTSFTHQRNRNHGLLVAAIDNIGDIKRRITNIMKHNKFTMNLSAMALCLALLFAATSMTGAAGTNGKVPSGDQIPTISNATVAPITEGNSQNITPSPMATMNPNSQLEALVFEGELPVIPELAYFEYVPSSDKGIVIDEKAMLERIWDGKSYTTLDWKDGNYYRLPQKKSALPAEENLLIEANYLSYNWGTYPKEKKLSGTIDELYEEATEHAKWFLGSDEYFTHPQPITPILGEDGVAVTNFYEYEWDHLIDNVPIFFEGLSIRIMGTGMSTLSLRWSKLEPTNTPAKNLLITAQEAINALNFVRSITDPKSCTEYQQGDVILGIRLVYTIRFSPEYSVYHPAWHLVVTNPSRPHVNRHFLVDCESATVFNDHDGLIETVKN